MTDVSGQRGLMIIKGWMNLSSSQRVARAEELELIFLFWPVVLDENCRKS